MAQQVSLPESKLRMRRRQRRVRLLWFFLVLAGLVVCGVVGLLWSPWLRVTSVSVSGSVTYERLVEDTAWRILSGTYGYVVPRATIVFYPKQEIQRAIVREFPALYEARVRGGGLHTLTISVSERVPAALWCGESASSSTRCARMDAAGVVYSAPQEENVDITQYRQYTGTVHTVQDLALPMQFLEPGAFSDLVALIDSMEKVASNDRIVRVDVQPGGDVEVWFVSGFAVRFVRTVDAKDTLERFSLARKAAPFADTPLGQFSYLDLRFGDKVYYKKK